MSNNKKENKKKMFILFAGVGVVIILIAVIIVVAVNALFGKTEEEYSAIPSDLMNLNLTPKPVEDIKKIDAYETDLSDKKGQGDLSFKDGLTLNLSDSSEVVHQPQTIAQNTQTVAASPLTPTQEMKAVEPPKSTKKTASTKSEGQRPTPRKETPATTANRNDMNPAGDSFGKTISFYSSVAGSNAAVHGTIKACINIGGVISPGDAVQVRLLEAMGDMPRNTVLTATCQMTGNRLNLVFDNIRVKAYDMDGREGLAIADSQIRDGVNVIKDEAQNALESGASAVNSTLGEGVRLLSRVFGSNKSKGHQSSIEVPSAYAIYLKSY